MRASRTQRIGHSVFSERHGQAVSVPSRPGPETDFLAPTQRQDFVVATSAVMMMIVCRSEAPANRSEFARGQSCVQSHISSASAILQTTAPQ